jgi:hypothetical protein
LGGGALLPASATTPLVPLVAATLLVSLGAVLVAGAASEHALKLSRNKHESSESP